MESALDPYYLVKEEIEENVNSVLTIYRLIYGTLIHFSTTSLQFFLRM